MGAIKKTWLSADRKKEMLEMVAGAQRQGVSMRKSCKMLIIYRRRVLRWSSHQRDGQGLANGRPGPERAPHQVLPVEREQVLALARREDYADCSHRILTVLGWEQKIAWVSFSATYRILKKAGLTQVRQLIKETAEN